MQIVDVPAGARQLDNATQVRVDHAQLGGLAPLRTGRVVVLRDRDGLLRLATVEAREVRPAGTTYVFHLGHRTGPATVARPTGPSVPVPRRALEVPTRLEVADVVAALRALAARPDDPVSSDLR